MIVRSVLAIVLLSAAIATNASAGVGCALPQDTDSTFRSAAFSLWPAHYKHDWRWLKALYIYESGVAQCHPGELAKRNTHILRTATQMRQYLDDWIAPRPHDCRMKMAIASYLVGTDNVRRHHVASGFRCWDQMAAEMPVAMRYVANVEAIREGLQ